MEMMFVRRCGRGFIELKKTRHHSAIADIYSDVVCVRGTEIGKDCRYFFAEKDGRRISPWHDIPLHCKGRNVFSFVNEIPRGTRAKMEIACDEAYNPIKQDVSKNKLRYYHMDSIVHYGCFPQTWEDPSQTDPHTNCKGDNDPLDVVEISRSSSTVIGQVYPVKVLGILGMIDDQETDWKIIALSMKDPIAHQVNSVNDLDAFPEYRNLVRHIVEWFRGYKIPDGKPPNQFAFDGVPQSSEFALKVIEDTHRSWSQLVSDPKGTQQHSLWLRTEKL